VPTEDLIQVASLALIRAVERFEPERGLEFSTFATPTIVGELKRHFRDKGWAVRVPRRVQDLHVRLGAIVGDLTHQLGRSPTVTELARAARASEEDVLEAMEAARAYRAGTIEEHPDPESSRAPTPLGRLDPALFDLENRLVVERLLVELPPRERLMIQLRYFEDMTQREIADRLGISQMHVSRLLDRSLNHLRRLVDDQHATTAGFEDQGR
jgi:RNA polymerase sigma-B factor